MQVLGIGKNVPANNYAAFSILAALVGAFSIQQVQLIGIDKFSVETASDFANVSLMLGE